jgi:hypothetical protein
MHLTVPVIEECVRIPSPCPPFGLACDGPHLWVGSTATRRIYGIDSRNGKPFEEVTAPGTPFGIAVTGDALRVIVADDADDRYLCRYVMGKDFKRSDRAALPERSGSSVAYDGHTFFVGQRYDKRIVQIDGNGRLLHTFETPRMPVGITIVAGRIYVLANDDGDDLPFVLLRMDVRGAEPEIVELAEVPFVARALAYDGRRFWTADKSDNTLVSFAKPD